MPSRRRSAEPSPRLLALLGAGDAGTADPAAAPRGPGEPWLPQREWLLGQDADPSGPAAAGGRDRPAGERRAPVPSRPAPTRTAPPGRHRRPRPPGPALLTVPKALAGARLSAPRAAVLGMVLVVVLAVAVFGVRVAWARAASAPQPVERTAAAERGTSVVSRTSGPGGFGDGAGAAAARGTGPAGAAATGATSTARGVVVHVVGQVRRPGLVVLATGGRVGDALAKAGGALPGADLTALNLARPLVDGEQVRVPKPGEAPPPAPPGPSGGAGGEGAAATGPVNLNTASAAALEELPGVGPVLAQRIVDWRTEHGRFTSVDELGEVSGIGEKMFAQLQDKVTV
ncbi:ComEA family DNA-binding protein [Pedococcus cremeus]|nr:ComEA family DNA-binding protein [Pedococcus cremeus]